MKKLLVCLLLSVAFSLTTYAQDNNPKEEKIYRSVTEKPTPKYDFTAYLSQNLKYPDDAQKNNVQGKVIVEFVIEKDGSISNTKVINGADIGYGLSEEAIRVVKNAPKWTPAKSNGTPVRFAIAMPVSFKLPQ